MSSPTVLDLINNAFAEIGINPDISNLTDSDIRLAMARLPGVIQQLSAYGIKYPFPNGGDVKQESNLDGLGASLVFKTLAMDMASAYGKTPDNLSSLRLSLDTLRQAALIASSSTDPLKIRHQNAILGTGSKPFDVYGSQYVRPTDAVESESGNIQGLTYPGGRTRTVNNV